MAIYFNEEKELVRKTVEPAGLEQFKKTIETEKPKEIWHSVWFKDRPLIVIVDYATNGLLLYYNNWQDKTPQLYTIDRLFNQLKGIGLEYCYLP